MSPRGRGLVENEEQHRNKKMKSIVVEEQEQEEGTEAERETGFVDFFIKMNPRGRGLVENEEQHRNKKMKSIVVEEQEQEEGTEAERETGLVDLDRDTLRNVLERVGPVTLGRAACVNKLWREVAQDKRLWEPVVGRLWAGSGGLEFVDILRNLTRRVDFFRFLRNMTSETDIYSSRKLRSLLLDRYLAREFYSTDFSMKGSFV